MADLQGLDLRTFIAGEGIKQTGNTAAKSITTEVDFQTVADRIFFVGEYYHLQVIRPNFVWANGQTLTSVSTKYPQLKAWLKDTGTYGGAWLKKTLTEWNAEWNSTKWNAPDTSGNRAGMSPYYVLDESANTIKVPDLRGAYMAAAGFDSQAVGKTLADAIRNISGFISGVRYGVITSTAKAFNDASSPAQMPETAGVNPVQYMRDITLDASRIVPTATVNRPRSLTSYLCLYTGAPA